MSAAPVLDLRDWHFAYCGRAVLKGVSFSVTDGEIFSLLGANGADKSSLLRLALGLIKSPGGLPVKRAGLRELQMLAGRP